MEKVGKSKTTLQVKSEEHAISTGASTSRRRSFKFGVRFVSKDLKEKNEVENGECLVEGFVSEKETSVNNEEITQNENHSYNLSNNFPSKIQDISLIKLPDISSVQKSLYSAIRMECNWSGQVLKI